MHAVRLSPPATTPGIFPRPYAFRGGRRRMYGMCKAPLREHPGAVLVGSVSLLKLTSDFTPGPACGRVCPLYVLDPNIQQVQKLP
jgi:hypothetical protein